MLPDKFKERFSTTLGDSDVAALDMAGIELRARIEPVLQMRKGAAYDDILYVRANILAYRQMLLYRAIQVFEGALIAALNENVYATALCVRAHFETAAAMGYLHKKLLSIRAKHIDLVKLGSDLAQLVLGSKQQTERCKPPVPKNVTTMLQETDKIINDSIQDDQKEYPIFVDSYGFLCEYAHPNYHSNRASFDVDSMTDKFIFRYGKQMRDEEDSLLQYLLISNPRFLYLYDEIPQQLPTQ